MVILSGCGGGGQTSTTPTEPPVSDQSTSRAVPPDSGNQTSTEASDTKPESSTPEPTDGRGLMAGACAVLPLSAAESFDPRLTRKATGGEGKGVSGCNYSPPEEGPSIQLIMELIPAPAEASESVAKVVCQKTIAELNNEPTNKTSEAVPTLGEEGNVISGFIKADSNLDGDETIYVADWREEGMCAQLIFSSVEAGPAEPLSKFTALAESISSGG